MSFSDTSIFALSKSIVVMGFLLLTSPAHAFYGQCFTLEEDVNTQTQFDWMIVDNGVELIWRKGDAKTVLITGSGGSGIPWRQAIAPHGQIYWYRRIRDVLFFDSLVYYPGCQAS